MIPKSELSVYVCSVCVCACACACARVRVCMCVCACVHTCLHGCLRACVLACVCLWLLTAAILKEPSTQMLWGAHITCINLVTFYQNHHT